MEDLVSSVCWYRRKGIEAGDHSKRIENTAENLRDSGMFSIEEASKNDNDTIFAHLDIHQL